MGIILVVGGLIALLFAVKAFMFLPNKTYLKQVMVSLRAKGAEGIAEALDASTAGAMGKEIADAAWLGLSDNRAAGISPQDYAAGMIAERRIKGIAPAATLLGRWS